MISRQVEHGLRLSGQLVNLIAIQSLRIELAAKAESAVVEALDRKLAGIEILLREAVVDKEQFYEFSSGVEARLIRIEQHLLARKGDTDDPR